MAEPEKIFQVPGCELRNGTAEDFSIDSDVVIINEK
jgi:hypothetical protein